MSLYKPKLMTYKDWTTRTVAKFELTKEDVELMLFNQKALIPNPDAEAVVSIAKKALCYEFATLIPLSNISEGGYSVSWNFDAVKLWYNATCREVGLQPIGTPKVKSRGGIW